MLSLRVTRTSGINERKGIASGNATRNGVYVCLLAENGIEGPTDLSESQKGWKQIIGGEFDLDISPECSQYGDSQSEHFNALSRDATQRKVYGRRTLRANGLDDHYRRDCRLVPSN
ncbi:MmgE/PrpD family protein [Natronomonas salsuginis]|uniref:MmgE/PrpD family protein n=1 Tax=Natronomonas salsuginis TaxID=2217661 RepID=UPI00248241F3|nr:MmgE/PrpD family protein [Natronomonas salsuginis]